MPPPPDARHLPSLKALRGFEAATRHQSVRAAAEELHLTHPAVSHQIQQIEDLLGVALFEPAGRQVVSTEEGRRLYPFVRAALDTLGEGIAAVRGTGDAPLRVQTYVTASIRWLAPRVPLFLAAHPDVRLSLTTCAAEWTFDEANADIGMIYARETPDPARYFWQPLFPFTLEPVCSPAFLQRVGGSLDPAALAGLPLVVNHTEADAWPRWFAEQGITAPALATGQPCVMVDTLALALELALAGRGIALANRRLIARELADGRLVAPLAHVLEGPGEWGLICRHAAKDRPPVRRFRTWLAAHIDDSTLEPLS